MRRTSEECRKRQRGSVLVESGLTVVIFMFLIFGIMEFCRAVWAYNLLSHAAREATRYAMARGSTTPHPATVADITNIVNSEAVGLNPADVQVNVSWIPNNKPGSSVKVALQYSFSPVTALIGSGKFGSTSQVIITQ
jgi:Flp pilus assembly protein TadG